MTEPRRPGLLTSLLGQVAMVTGASQGIGRATALMLAEAGADVVVNHFGDADLDDRPTN